MAKYTRYKTIALGVQYGDVSCGFWALFFALGIMLGLSLDPAGPCVRTSIPAVKEILITVYTEYISDSRGLRLATVFDALNKCGLDRRIFQALPRGDDVVRAFESNRGRD